MYGATVGKLGILNREAATNQAVCAIFPSEVLDNKYLFWYLRAVRSDLVSQAVGGAQPNISQGILREIPIPLAPPEQQIRIVAEIEKQFSRLDEAVANLKRVKANLKRYKAAVLKAAVEGKLTEEWRKKNPDVEPADKLLERILAERREKWQGRGKYKEPVAPDISGLPKLPEGWVWARLGSLPVDVFDGPFGSNLKSSDYVPAGVRVIRLENIGSREFVNCKESFVTEQKYEQLKKHEVRHGDIIFSSFVSNETRVVMLPEHIEKAINKADCFCVRVNGNVINKRYLEAFLATRTAYEQLVGEVHGATRPRINTTQLKESLIPIPPKDEQVEIVSQISAVLSIVEVAEAEIERNHQRADCLCQSILKKAFSGQLVPQEPNDEPASLLMDRVRNDVRAIHESPLPKTQQPTEPKLPLVAESNTTYDVDITSCIIAAMQPGREYSRADLADPLGLTTGQWNAAILELKLRGQVRQVGEKRGARYVISR